MIQKFSGLELITIELRIQAALSVPTLSALHIYLLKLILAITRLSPASSFVIIHSE
jgi:hypothetical protein